MEKISIITASYNYAQYISETIESVINQTYNNWELIIVDDGSTDNSVDVIKSYCKTDSRIKLYTHENGENKGLIETVKLGLQVIDRESKWVAFLESDDSLTPDYLEKKLKVAEKHPEVKFILNDVNLFGDNDAISEFNKYFDDKYKILNKLTYPANLKKYFKISNVVPSFSCVMLKHEFAERLDFNCAVPRLLDYYLWTQLADKNNFYYINEKLTNWRMHKNSYINRINDDEVNIWWFIKVQIKDNLSRKWHFWHVFQFLLKIYGKGIFINPINIENQIMDKKKFDYHGFSSKKLNKLCNKKYIRKEISKNQYGVSQQYSQGRLYHEYAKFPRYKRLYCYSEHGIEFDVTYPHEIENDAEMMFVFSDGKLESYRKSSQKPVYKVVHPFAWYRKENNIKQDDNAKGTIAFPSHSTPDIKCNYDIVQYIDQLKSLPESMQPVCVCLYMTDILNGQHKIYQENGIPVYTAGNVMDSRFVDRYYDILKHFKYCTSNCIGSYTFYSVEMGIPFSLYGVKSKLQNISDPNFQSDILNSKPEQYVYCEKLFESLNTSITPTQREFVESKLGLDGDTLSRNEMKNLFEVAYKKRGSELRDHLNEIKYYMKSVIVLPIKRYLS